MAELKTKPTGASVKTYIDAVPDEQKRKDSRELLAIFKRITGETAKMWGPSIVGFGSYKYISNKKEFEAALTGFSPRKQNLTLYLMVGAADYSDLLAKLGKHTTGKGCLYINKLSDVDMKVLERLIKKSYETFKKVAVKMYKEREATLPTTKKKNV